MNLLLIIILFLTGCATPEQLAVRRYFWPLPPNEPKIEFVASYWSADDFPKKSGQTFLEATVGRERPISFDKPWGIASDGEGKVYISDTNLREVVVYDLKNYSVEIFGKGAYSGLFRTPVGIVLDAGGNIYVSDPRKNKVYVFTKDEKPLRVIGDDTALNWPLGMAVDDALKRLYVVNRRSHNIAAFDFEGGYLFSIGKRGVEDGEFNYPSDVDIDSKGNIVVADSMNARVQIFDHEGKFISKFGQRGTRPEEFQILKGLAVSRNDDIYVTDSKTDAVMVFNKNGEHLTSIGGTAAVAETLRLNPGGFLLIQDIFIDKNDAIYAVDSLNRRFQVFQIINEEWLKEHPIK